MNDRTDDSQDKDDIDPLVRVQGDLMELLCELPIYRAKDRYLEAEQLLGGRTELGKRLRDGARSSKVLVALYWRLAEHYRTHHEPHSGQLTIFDQGMGHHERLGLEWYKFYVREAERLARDDYWILTLLRSVAYQGTDRGAAALVECEAMLADGQGSWCHICDGPGDPDWMREIVQKLRDELGWDE